MAESIPPCSGGGNAQLAPEAPSPCNSNDPNSPYSSNLAISAAPALQVKKTGSAADTNGDGIVGAGDAATYSFLVRADLAMGNIVISDPLIEPDGHRYGDDARPDGHRDGHDPWPDDDHHRARGARRDHHCHPDRARPDGHDDGRGRDRDDDGRRRDGHADRRGSHGDADPARDDGHPDAPGRDGHQTIPPSTITQTLPGQTVTQTLLGTTVTVTAPGQGATVTLPGATVTAPGETVTAPGATVTTTIQGIPPVCTPAPAPGAGIKLARTGEENAGGLGLLLAGAAIVAASVVMRRR